jgi:hypothetical protein
VPVLPSRDEFDQYQQDLVRGTGKEFRFKDTVSDMPQNALDWVEENREKISGWKNPPIFMQDNPKSFGKKK